jgi:hypothetical protein
VSYRGDDVTEVDKEALRELLDELTIEHRDLDDVIHRLHMVGGMEQMQMQRMKRRKLRLKEKIVKIEDMLIPDIIA